jgi:HlyD family secretion protein
LESITVKLGDRVTRGQRIAKIEDQELLEQVKQAQAAFQVASATIRQREADLELAKTNAERSRNLFQRQLLPQQTLDDSEAKYQSAQAALDLARAQNTQSQARLDELGATLQNTIITSPVNGFVARRAADPGAFVSNSAPIVDVVDISTVRLVVNVIEKDLKQLAAGNSARVEVDAFPGESFQGRIARISPVLDPATRTASIEIEIPNGQFRLKPGMYARVGIVTDSHPNAIVVPTNSVVDVNGTRGVYLAVNNLAQFRPVKTGIENNTRTEILDGVSDGDRVVTTGAPALRNGDPIVLAGRGGPGGRQTQEGRATGQPSEQGQTPQGRQGGTVGEGGFGARRGGGTSQGTGGSGAAPGGASGEGSGTERRGGTGGRRGQGPAGVPQGTPETR